MKKNLEILSRFQRKGRISKIRLRVLFPFFKFRNFIFLDFDREIQRRARDDVDEESVHSAQKFLSKEDEISNQKSRLHEETAIHFVPYISIGNS